MHIQYEIFQKNNTSLYDCIGIYENAVSPEFCQMLIEHFESSITFRTDDHRKQAQEMQLVGDPREESKMFVDALSDFIYPYGPKFERELHEHCHEDYKPKDPPLTESNNIHFRSFQIQKYTPEDKGYPAVHIEDGPEHCRKYLASILYLNTVLDGETVFPMCGRVLAPETGDLVIWPASLPFYHCGRASKSDKYIITTWFEF